MALLGAILVLRRQSRAKSAVDMVSTSDSARHLKSVPCSHSAVCSDASNNVETNEAADEEASPQCPATYDPPALPPQYPATYVPPALPEEDEETEEDMLAAQEHAKMMGAMMQDREHARPKEENEAIAIAAAAGVFGHEQSEVEAHTGREGEQESAHQEEEGERESLAEQVPKAAASVPKSALHSAGEVSFGPMHAIHSRAHAMQNLQASSSEAAANTMASSPAWPDRINHPPAEPKTFWKNSGTALDNSSSESKMAADTAESFERAQDAEALESKLKYGQDAKFMLRDKEQASAG